MAQGPGGGGGGEGRSSYSSQLEDLVNQVIMEVLIQHSTSGNPFTALSASPKPASAAASAVDTTTAR